MPFLSLKEESSVAKGAFSNLMANFRFYVAFDGALPIKVTWFKDGKEIKSSFRNQVLLIVTWFGSGINVLHVTDYHDQQLLHTTHRTIGEQPHRRVHGTPGERRRNGKLTPARTLQN